MEIISERDRSILRRLAEHRLELAASEENKAVLARWRCIEEGRRGEPTVRLLASNFVNETVLPYLQCEGEKARQLEFDLRFSTVGRELFGDDTPVTDEFHVWLCTWATPFGAVAKRTVAAGENSKGYHIDPIIHDLEEDYALLGEGSFGADTQLTDEKAALAEEIFGDLLHVKKVMYCLTGAITNPLVHLTGLENYCLAMYDCPALLHRIMDEACTLYERYYDFLEDKGLLLPTVGTSPVGQESFAFNHELPADKAVHTTDCWGFLEAQEATAVSPETFAEFVFPYHDRLAKRFGLLSYGCCERVDAIWPYISRWKNLRKLSVSPFNNERQVGEYLRGSSIVYYSKPRAELLTVPGPLDEDAIVRCFREIAESASGCMLEVAQREAGTIFRDPARGRRYVELAKQTIDRYWKP